MIVSFRPLSGFYEFLFKKDDYTMELTKVSVPCRGSMSFYEKKKLNKLYVGFRPLSGFYEFLL